MLDGRVDNWCRAGRKCFFAKMDLGVDFFGSDAIDHRLVEWVVEWDRGDDGGAPGGKIAVIGRELCFFDAFPDEESVTGVQRMIVEMVDAVPERLIPNVEGAGGLDVWKVRCVRSRQRGGKSLHCSP